MEPRRDTRAQGARRVRSIIFDFDLYDSVYRPSYIPLAQDNDFYESPLSAFFPCIRKTAKKPSPSPPKKKSNQRTKD